MAKQNPKEASAPKGQASEKEAPSSPAPVAKVDGKLQAFGAAVGKHPSAIDGSPLKVAADKCAKDGDSESAKALAQIVVKDPAIIRQAASSGGGCEIYNTAEALLK